MEAQIVCEVCMEAQMWAWQNTPENGHGLIKKDGLIQVVTHAEILRRK